MLIEFAHKIIISKTGDYNMFSYCTVFHEKSDLALKMKSVTLNVNGK